MKKLLLLFFGFLLSASLSAQIDTLFIETFDPGDSITTLSLGTATTVWKDTNNVSISGNQSYHGKVQAPATGSNSSEVVFRTNSFSTVGKTFVFLNFYHIAKINQVNSGLIRISTDNGATWTTLNNNNVIYLGTSNWRSSSNFQEASYNIPNQGINHWFAGTDPPVQNSWWQSERFDISNLAIDANGNGYPNVQIEFSCFEVLNPNLTGRNYGDGWWVDNLVITGSNCELFPPLFHFNYTPIPCFPIRPTGAITQEPTNNYKVGARVTDTVAGGATHPTWVSGIDSVTVFYRVINSSGTGAWQNFNLTLTSASNFEYQGTFNSVQVGDTIEYYFKAWDLACPNTARFPDSLANPQNAYIRFWPQAGLPFKCGAPDCGTLPGTIKTFPWVENFEGPEWVAGTGLGDNGTTHRGNFPNEQTGMRYWNVQPPENSTGYAWSIRTGTTGTPFTGPNGNHTPGGAKYVYAEGSQGNQNTTTTLITPCIDLTNVTRCYALEFYYHFFGEDMGTMRIDIDTGTNNPAWYTGYYFIRKEQQKAQSDPWERALIPLKEFNGQFIRIRFLSAKQTTKVGAAARADMAIDDLRIFEPTPVDAEILEVTAPVEGLCSYSSAETIEVVIRNNGCDSLLSLPLQIQTNSGAIQNETATLTLGTGDTATYTLTTTANMSALGTYNIHVWANHAMDTIPDNDSASSATITHVASYNTYPLVMDFESVTPNSSQTGTTLFTTETGLDPAFVWKVGSGYTFTRGTGPKYGHYQKGQYFYTEATGSTGNVSTYMVTTQCMDFTGMPNATLDFYYHMVGANADGIEIEVNEPGVDAPDVWNAIPSSLVNTYSGNYPLSNYDYKRVNLSAYNNKQIKIRFKASRTGVGDLADIAIDKVMIYNRIASDVGVEFINNPPLSWPANQVFNHPAVIEQVEVRNFGTSTATGVTATLAITPKCGANAGVTTTYTSTTSTNIPANSSATLTMPNIDVIIPAGECEICAYANLAGDTYSFNDTVCRTVTGLGSYDLDFYDDFDNCDYDEYGFFSWSPNNSSNYYLQWERGEAPASSQFSSLQASDNIWATGLSTGHYIDGKQEVLRMPTLDNFDTIVSATIAFYQNVDMGNNAAGAVQINRGGWIELGGNLATFSNIGQNWYTGYFGTIQGPAGTGVTKGFTGSSVNGANPSGWAYSVFPMSQLNFEPNAIPFRFYFSSTAGANTARNREGWAIDDFEVYIPPQNSATPEDWVFTNPLQIPTFAQPLDIFIRNTGAKVLDSSQVKAQWFDDVAGTNLTWDGPFEWAISPRFFIEGSRFRYDYTDSIPGSVITTGLHKMCLISQRPNNKVDNRPSDDTVCYTVAVLPEYEFDIANGDTAYCNNFEDNNGALPFIALNTETYARGQWSWERGTPTQFPGAFSGTGCWMTGLDSNYRSRDQSGLFSPVFVIDTSTAYEISFMHKFETEKYHDGGVVEVTLDGGRSWQVLGFANETNWYNTEYVTALDIIKPGWTDTADWDTASYVFEFDTAANRAVFRFRFESDWSIQDKGWAIDDFCMTTTNKKPTFRIGNKEYNPVPNSYIGELNPNPTNDITHLPLFNAQAKDVSVTIVNVLGQMMMQKDYHLERGSASLVFETFDYTPGIYFVNLSIDGQRVTRKLIVK
ncbi:T9SS type A sorting domain-containing protein [Croceimicrobium sp.]|uniref:T9SS type A sorting domain-containing protein n=1 Tax=Croceimicrobium sp. TaxID=2828340 RepID=UPI003BA8A218